ncbi:hypothetical protein [Natronobacterium gregoryi]|nr:hypothetical protein [Natronobacterium gregoryi]ELY74311.1 hypothetical protein C490_00040 [Natronobacterium gregoryi SP2]
MVFPLRELQFAAKNRDRETLREVLSTLSTRGAAWDVEPTDLGAWLTPPASLVERLPESARRSTTERTVTEPTKPIRSRR